MQILTVKIYSIHSVCKVKTRIAYILKKKVRFLKILQHLKQSKIKVNQFKMTKK